VERRVIREVMWSAWDGLGLGHLSLAARDGGVAEMVPGVTGGRPFRVAYELRCHSDRRVRAVRTGVPGEPPGVELLPDGKGNDQIGSPWDGSFDKIYCGSGSNFVEAGSGDYVAPDRERVERV
jgi:hypothetical protein